MPLPCFACALGFFCLLCSWCCFAVDVNEGCTVLTGGTKQTEPTFSLHWTLSGQVITFDVELSGSSSPILGYVAAGISDPDAGIFSGGPSDLWVINPQAGSVTDSYFAMMKIREDPNQDLLPNSQVWTDNDGKTVKAQFSRSLNTLDTNDVPINDRSYQLIWAYRLDESFQGFGGMRPDNMGVAQTTINFFSPGHKCSEAKQMAAKQSQDTLSTTKRTAKPTGKGTWLSSGSNAGRFRLDWEVQSDGETISFTMTGKTRGWVSFGWNPTGYTMSKCDKYTGWYTGGSGVLIDSWATGHDTPKDDLSLGGTLDTRNPTFWNNSTHTVISFTRALVTGDAHDYDVSDQSVSLLWALGESGETMEWQAGNEPSYDEHFCYGGGGIQFLDSATPNTTNCTGTPGSGEYSNSDKSFVLSWHLTSDSSSMVFELTAKTTGWASFGINEMCSMTNADKVTGWVSSSNSVTLLDSWATGYAVPTVDTARGGTADLTAQTGWQNTTHTYLTWTRLLDTGDSSDYKIYDHWYYLMWAIGSSDGSGTSYSQHSSSGYGCNKVNFMGCSSSPTTSSVVSSAGGISSTATSTASSVTCSDSSSWTSSNSKYHVSWNVSQDLAYITFEVTAATQGWVSLGLGTSCNMQNADKIVGWVDTTNSLTIFDAWSSSYSVPSLDTSLGGVDNVLNPSGYQNSTHTVLRWTRLLNTGDSNDITITASSMTLMWGIGNADGTSTTSYLQHPNGGYGCATVTFIGCTTASTVSSTATASSYVASSGTNSNCSATGTGSWASSSGKFAVSWNSSANGQAITFTMVGETLGWISIGFCSSFSMKNSDKYVGWVEGSTVTLLDTSCSGHSIPELDTSLGGTNDAYNVYGYENASHTVISFTRLLDTGDTNDYVLDNSNLYLLWAWADQDGISTSDYETHGMSKNVNYGGVQLNLFACDPFIGTSNKGFFLQNPGQGLALTTAAIILVLSLVFWVRRAAGKAFPASPLPAIKGKEGADTVQGSQMVEMQEMNYRVPPIGASAIVGDSESSCCLGAASPCSKRIFGMWALSGLILSIIYLALNLGWALVWVVVWPEKNPKPATLLETIARVLGNMVSANMAIAVLPATRNSLLVFLLGTSFERTLGFHRWLGRWTLVLICAHMVVFFINRGVELIWTSGALVKPQVLGAAALVCCFGLNLLSINIIRRKVFNLFYWSHLFFIFPFFVLASLHNAKFLPFAYVSAILYGVDRVFRLLWGTIPRRATEVVALTDGVVRVRWPRHPLAHYEPGQYVFLNFPQLELLEWHPFTLCSSPRERQCEVNIKWLGNHTATLLKRAPGQGTLWVRADGPYGQLQIPIKEYRVLVLLAGGIGVTPMMSILRDIYGTIDADGESTVGRPGRLQHVHFHWGIKNFEQLAWFSNHLEYASAQSKSGKVGVPALHVKLHASQQNEEGVSSPFGTT